MLCLSITVNGKRNAQCRDGRTGRIGRLRRQQRPRGEGWRTVAARLTPWRPYRRRHRAPGPPSPCCDRRRGGGDQRDPSLVAAGHGCISFPFRGRMATPTRAFPAGVGRPVKRGTAHTPRTYTYPSTVTCQQSKVPRSCPFKSSVKWISRKSNYICSFNKKKRVTISVQRCNLAPVQTKLSLCLTIIINMHDSK